MTRSSTIASSTPSNAPTVITDAVSPNTVSSCRAASRPAWSPFSRISIFPSDGPREPTMIEPRGAISATPPAGHVEATGANEGDPAVGQQGYPLAERIGVFQERKTRVQCAQQPEIRQRLEDDRPAGQEQGLSDRVAQRGREGDQRVGIPRR